MQVWIKQDLDINDIEVDIMVFVTEQEALQAALTEINQRIDDDWDMDNSDQLACAEAIEELVDQKKYREAMEKWNEFESENNMDYAHYYSVFSRNVYGYEGEAPVALGAYKATDPGATCRGQCKSYSPDAYADKPDGTFLCYQCKLFQGIFTSGSRP